MARKPKSNLFSWKQLLIAFGVTVSVAYSVAIADVVRRNIGTSRRVEALRNQVQQLEATEADLKAQLEYVQSDYYTEKVAREDLKWGKPGEKAFVPLLKDSPTSSGSADSSQTPPQRQDEASPKSRLEEFLELLPKKSP